MDEKDKIAVSPAMGQVLNKLNGEVSRRTFIGKCGKIVAFGALAQFTMGIIRSSTPDDCPTGHISQDSCQPLNNNPDNCPGGTDDKDFCYPPDEADKCPGGAANVDKCQSGDNDDECPSGNHSTDICNKGVDDICTFEASDVCAPNGGKDTDKCLTSKPADDICTPENLAGDSCNTGSDENDLCAAGTSTAKPPTDGDVCPGGGDEQDHCEGTDGSDAAGDYCPEGTFGSSDDCKASNPDKCIIVPFDDDVCTAGENTKAGEGFSDLCIPGDTLASDQCDSGSDDDDYCGRWASEQDYCTLGSDDDVCGTNADEQTEDFCNANIPGSDDCSAYNSATSTGSQDECPAGSEDVCDPAATPKNPDECIPNITNSDECSTGAPAEDECPTGASSDDVCNPGISGSDVPE